MDGNKIGDFSVHVGVMCFYVCVFCKCKRKEKENTFRMNKRKK